MENMNDIMITLLLAGYKFMLETQLRQPRFMYSACGRFIEHKENTKIKKKDIADRIG